MPITDLVIAETPEATAISEAASLDRWQSIDISIIGDVALHELVAHLTERDFQDVFNSIPNLTPGPDDSEPWDEDAWVTPVLQPSKEYLAAITDIPDSKLPEVGAWWFTTTKHLASGKLNLMHSRLVSQPAAEAVGNCWRKRILLIRR